LLLFYQEKRREKGSLAAMQTSLRELEFIKRQNKDQKTTTHSSAEVIC
jgi:hypothetical protein